MTTTLQISTCIGVTNWGIEFYKYIHNIKFNELVKTLYIKSIMWSVISLIIFAMATPWNSRQLLRLNNMPVVGSSPEWTVLP